MRYDRLLEGKRALITGGANGLGRACALLFAEHGAIVTIADIDAANGEAALAELRSIEPACVFYPVDLRDEGDINAMCGAYLNAFGAPDVWLNSAGMIKLGFVDELACEALDDMMSINLVAPMLIMNRLVPAMIEKRGGSVVQLASEYALTGYNAASGYAATMGGLHAMTNTFAADCAQYGVRVNCLLLGAGTGAMAALKAADMTHKESKQLWGAITPLWRKAEAREVANAALFLASDMASYITGEALFVNGGQHIVAHNEIFRAGGWWVK